MGLFNRAKTKRQQELVRRNPQLMAGQDSYTFRRSRTLTGSASSSIKAANETKAQIKSPRLKAHELRQHRRHVVISLFGCLLLAGTFYWLLTQFVAQITTLNYTPLVKQQPEHSAYVEAIQEYLRSHPLERFRFALNPEGLTEYLKTKHPEVAGVMKAYSTSLGNGGVTLELRRPVVGWKVGSKQYYVDASGVSFQKNYYDAPAVTVKDRSGINPENGGAIASNRFLSFLGRVVALAGDMKVGEVTTVTIPPGVGTRTVEINIKGKTTAIRMHIDRDPAEQVEDMARAFKYFASKRQQPKYIDVRVGGRAFYRE